MAEPKLFCPTQKGGLLRRSSINSCLGWVRIRKCLLKKVQGFNPTLYYFDDDALYNTGEIAGYGRDTVKIEKVYSPVTGNYYVAKHFEKGIV